MISELKKQKGNKKILLLKKKLSFEIVARGQKTYSVRTYKKIINH